MNKRLTFVNEAFSVTDKFNGGFLKGSRTSDNIFIIQGLVQRRLALRKPFFICFVDFSKAFDLVNRNLLFFKLMKQGFHGRVIDKCNGKISPKIRDELGVNQGGNASPTLSRKYLSDLGDYLSKHVGICISEEIIAHLLWADDLVLLFDSAKGLQKQFDGLLQFCAKNLMIVNETKTKAMIFGERKDDTFYFNGKTIETVEQYKYLGVMISSINYRQKDVFATNHKHLCDKARRAVFSMYKKTKCIGTLPMKIVFHLFQHLIQPILLYGSEIWGISDPANSQIDTFFNWFLRCALGVKPSTSTAMIYGECGQVPLSVWSHVNVMTYHARLYNLPDTTVVKQVYNELSKLSNCGFATWVSRVRDLANMHNVELYNVGDPKTYKARCKSAIVSNFKQNWQAKLHDLNKYPIMRTYALFKFDFECETYLSAVRDRRYRNAISKFRLSSHNFEIERGRHCNPKVPVSERLCFRCNCIEDEQHFLISCKSYEDLRVDLYDKVSKIITDFYEIGDRDKFVRLMNSRDNNVLTWLGKFLYTAQRVRGGHYT